MHQKIILLIPYCEPLEVISKSEEILSNIQDGMGWKLQNQVIALSKEGKEIINKFAKMIDNERNENINSIRKICLSGDFNYLDNDFIGLCHFFTENLQYLYYAYKEDLTPFRDGNSLIEYVKSFNYGKCWVVLFDCHI